MNSSKWMVRTMFYSIGASAKLTVDAKDNGIMKVLEQRSLDNIVQPLVVYFGNKMMLIGHRLELIKNATSMYYNQKKNQTVEYARQAKDKAVEYARQAKNKAIDITSSGLASGLEIAASATDMIKSALEDFATRKQLKYLSESEKENPSIPSPTSAQLYQPAATTAPKIVTSMYQGVLNMFGGHGEDDESRRIGNLYRRHPYHYSPQDDTW